MAFADAPLILPFKPLTLEQVAELTGCPTETLDCWSEAMGLKEGEGIVGLDFMQALGVFTGWTWATEGSGPDRATCVALFVASVSLDFLERHIAAGFDFPVPPTPSARRGCFVECPVTHRRLSMRRLLAEFRERLERKFPPGVIR